MEPQIYHLSTQQLNQLFNEKLFGNIDIQDIKYYLNKYNLKENCNNLIPSKVYVVEDKLNHIPHHLLKYNDEYIKLWGDKPIFGNVLCVYGKKTYDKLADNYKFTGNVLDISF